MENPQDTCIPEPGLPICRLHHDERPTGNLRIDYILISLHVVGCIVDSECAVAVEGVVQNDNSVAFFISKFRLLSVEGPI